MLDELVERVAARRAQRRLVGIEQDIGVERDFLVDRKRGRYSHETDGGAGAGSAMGAATAPAARPVRRISQRGRGDLGMAAAGPLRCGAEAGVPAKAGTAHHAPPRESMRSAFSLGSLTCALAVAEKKPSARAQGNGQGG